MDQLPSFACDIKDVADDSIAFSFCTLVTKPELYRQMLVSWTAAGFSPEDCEFLFTDNSAGENGDGYRGLNRMIARARGRYVVLCHQDVLATDPRAALERCLADLTATAPDWAVAGNAGYTAGRKARVRLSDRYRYDRTLGPLPAQVVSLDENFLVIRRDALLGFSHDLSGFHLYGTDLVTQGMLRGRSAWVIGYHLEHLGRGFMDQSFADSVAAFTLKYRRALRPRKLRTTVTTVGLGAQDIESRFRAWKFRLKLMGKVPFAVFQPLTRWLEALPHDLYERRNGPNYVLDGTRFRIPAGAPLLARKALRRGFYEAPERAMIAKWLPKDLPVIELGGSYGIVSHAIRRHLTPGTPLLVVEANPDLLPFCRENAALAGSADTTRVIGAALAYGAETVRFLVTASVHTSHITDSDAVNGQGQVIAVPARSLANLLQTAAVVGDFSLVCDIEGAEFDLLQNDVDALQRCALMVMEIHPASFMDRASSITEFRRMLEAAGFEIIDHDALVIVAKRR